MSSSMPLSANIIRLAAKRLLQVSIQDATDLELAKLLSKGLELRLQLHLLFSEPQHSCKMRLFDCDAGLGKALYPELSPGN